MGSVGWVVLGVAIGAVAAALLTYLLLHRRTETAILEPATPTVPDGVAEVLRVLRSAGVVVGPHDEVLQATDLAVNLGLVRGSRVALAPVLELVRAVRRDQTLRAEEVEITRGGRVAAAIYGVRVAPLAHGLILILADDETAARRVEQTRRDFVANVSHELKTPIGALSLLAEAVEEAADDAPAVRRFAGRMGIESARITDLVSQIIDLSRLQADNPLDAPDLVDVDDVLADAIDRCRVDADRHGVTLTVTGAEGARVMGSARQLSVAVSNLVENAVVYSDPGGRVVVGAHRHATPDDDYVEISVSDAGIGIAPTELERVFERFYRVDYARSRANGGTGLGLAIVKHIAAAHNGEVRVWSQPGRGSTFTIKIPEHQPAHDPTAAGDVRPAVARDQIADVVELVPQTERRS